MTIRYLSAQPPLQKKARCHISPRDHRALAESLMMPLRFCSWPVSSIAVRQNFSDKPLILKQKPTHRVSSKMPPLYRHMHRQSVPISLLNLFFAPSAVRLDFRIFLRSSRMFLSPRTPRLCHRIGQSSTMYVFQGI